MSNPYYTRTSIGAFGQLAMPGAINAQFAAIQAGFDAVQTAIPAVTGAPGQIVKFNAAGTGFSPSVIKEDVSGNVGINVATAMANFHPYGSILLGHGASPYPGAGPSFHGLWPSYDSVKQRVVLQAISPTVTGLSIMVKQAAGLAAEQLGVDISNNGNVGLGTASGDEAVRSAGDFGVPNYGAFGARPATDRFIDIPGGMSAIGTAARNGVTCGVQMAGIPGASTVMSADGALVLAIAQQVIGALRAGGMLGLGTANPLDMLHLKRSGNVGARIESDGTGEAAITLANNTIAKLKNLSNTDVAVEINGVEVARITAAGNVGVGVSSPASKLDVAGAVRGTAFQTVSDVRAKQEIVAAQPCGEMLDRIKVVSYRLKATGEYVHQGVIAQQMQTVTPALVFPAEGEAEWSVNYLGLVPYLLHEAQELRRRLANMEREVREMRNRP